MIFLTEYSQNSFFARFSTFVSPEKIKVEKVISSICKRTTGQFICRRFTNPCLINTGFFTMKTKSALYLKYNFNSKSTLRISSEKIASSGVLYSWNASCRDSFVFFFFFVNAFLPEEFWSSIHSYAVLGGKSCLVGTLERSFFGTPIRF